MAVVFEDVNSTICQHTKLLQKCETIGTVIDYARCEKLVESMELYSITDLISIIKGCFSC